MTVQWTPDLATGAKEIDDQHKELFKRVDDLLTAFEQGKERAEVDKIIQYLGDYVIYHFGNEQHYMTKYSYSSAKAHTAQHEQLVRTFGKLKERLLKEGINAQLTEDTKQLVVDWLINHIKFSDKALGMFLKLKM